MTHSNNLIICFKETLLCCKLAEQVLYKPLPQVEGLDTGGHNGKADVASALQLKIVLLQLAVILCSML